MADPEVHIDWEHCSVTLHFYCSCGRSGLLDTNKAQYIQCEGCRKIFRLAGLLPVHRIFVNSEAETITMHEPEPTVEYELPPARTAPEVERPSTAPDCYCCSCLHSEMDDSLVSADPYCRNHGWAGTRPCVNHGSTGLKDSENHMPRSVQDARKSLNISL